MNDLVLLMSVFQLSPVHMIQEVNVKGHLPLSAVFSFALTVFLHLVRSVSGGQSHKRVRGLWCNKGHELV